jgi:hypothetical protein
MGNPTRAFSPSLAAEELDWLFAHLYRLEKIDALRRKLLGPERPTPGMRRKKARRPTM